MQLVIAETCRATGSATYHRKLPAQVSVLSCTVIMWNYDELCVFLMNFIMANLQALEKLLTKALAAMDAMHQKKAGVDT